jgi:MFS family permease
MLMPNSLAILGATFSGEAKGRAIGIWAATGAAMGALGPVLGGWLIDIVSWRAIFLLNLPLAVTAIVLAWRYVAPDADDGDRALNWTGALLATAGLGALTWSLTIGSGPGGWTPAAILGAAGAAAFLATFAMIEGRKGDKAMMPLALFASRSFVGLTLVTLLLYGAVGGLFVLVPFVLIKSGGYSATGAGAALLPLPIILSVASPVMGGLAGRVGPRLPLAIGPLVVALGFAVTLRTGEHAIYWTTVLPALVLIALGMSGAVAPLTTAVLNSVDAHHTGSASGFNSAVARTGRRDSVAGCRPGGARPGARWRIPYRHARRRGDVRRGFGERARPHRLESGRAKCAVSNQEALTKRPLKRSLLASALSERGPGARTPRDRRSVAKRLALLAPDYRKQFHHRGSAPAGCRPSRIAPTMSGASNVSRRPR